jgi:hypothetical protein
MRRDAAFVVCGVAQSCDLEAPFDRIYVRSHVYAIGLVSQIAYMCDRIIVRLEWGLKSHVNAICCQPVGGACSLECGWRFRPFLVKSHDRATTVMGCMMFHSTVCG